ALPRVRVFADLHCVTRWSRLGNLWEGVSARELLGRAGVRPSARFVACHAYDHGWTTNLPLEHFLSGVVMKRRVEVVFGAAAGRVLAGHGGRLWGDYVRFADIIRTSVPRNYD